jgi:hypothetical protein
VGVGAWVTHEAHLCLVLTPIRRYRCLCGDRRGDEDTTAVALMWAMYELSRAPHVQAALQREIDAFMDATGTTDLTCVLAHRPRHTRRYREQ